MKLLILGGTIFLGRHIVEAALTRGHTVTLFNRGRHNPELFPEVEKIRGDRAVDLSPLQAGRWDAVIDTCGYAPRHVRASADYLANRAAHYTFISTISVYADFSKPDTTETSPLGKLDDPTVEEVTGETYGPLKALCEQAAEEAMPGQTLTIRPGLIVGPHDPTDRFTYWPVRVARGGAVLAPGNPQQEVQFIDGRDLAAWTVQQVEAQATGIYNATGPARPLTIQEFLTTCKQTLQSDADYVWVTETFLEEQKVGAFVEMPLWTPSADAGIEQIDCSKAIAAGLVCRPLAATIADTLAWHKTRPEPVTWRAGLTPEREAELLAEYRIRDTGYGTRDTGYGTRD